MASKSPVDEILAALPEVGLALWMLDQIADTWHAALYNPASPAQRFDATGASPAAALIGALKEAGVNVDDSD